MQEEEGGPNRGVVTRFDIQTFPQGPFYGSVVATLDAQLQTSFDFVRASPFLHLFHVFPG
jgi:hypothetical protein